MKNTSEQLKVYNDEELRLQLIGARLILMKLLSELGPDWNSAGTKLWAQRQIEELDG